MSECVVRMEMPKSCEECHLVQTYENDWGDVMSRTCNLIYKGYLSEVPKGERRADCPIICQLPEGHGRLVDKDAFEKDVSDALAYGLKEIPSEEGKQLFHVFMQEVLDNVKKRKILVPAEPPKEDA